jgi:hypothetical protein
MAQDKHVQVTADAVAWKDNPAFPKGVQTATLVGDPTKRRGTPLFRTFQDRAKDLLAGLSPC